MGTELVADRGVREVSLRQFCRRAVDGIVVVARVEDLITQPILFQA